MAIKQSLFDVPADIVLSLRKAFPTIETSRILTAAMRVLFTRYGCDDQLPKASSFRDVVRQSPNEGPRFTAPDDLHRQFASLCLDQSVLGKPRQPSHTLTLSLRQVGNHTQGSVEYVQELIHDWIIEQLIAHFLNVLKEVSLDPDQPISRLQMLGKDEWRTIVNKWNPDSTESNLRCIHEWFEDQVDGAPNAVAILYHGQETTYSALNVRANRLAHYLQRLGVAPETFVGVSLKDPLETIITMIAILKAGGVCVPLHPALPRERLRAMATSVPMHFVIADTDSVPLDLCDRATMLRLDEISSALELESPANLGRLATLNNSAFVIYTSGVSGSPKGIIRPYACLAPDPRGTIMIDREVCCLNKSLYIGAGIAAAFAPLRAGQLLVIIPEVDFIDPVTLVRTLSVNRITRLGIVPSQLRHIIDICRRLQWTLDDIRTVTVYGEAVTSDSLKSFPHVFPKSILLNGYTCTEIGSLATICTCPQDREYVSIGRPAQHVRVYILDADMNPLPIGLAGEIWLHSPTMSSGYLNAPALTGERFIPSPFNHDHGERLFRTGDFGRWRPDGEIEWLGRADQQVKIRGHRVDLGEIEAVLKQHDALADVAVIVRGGSDDPRVFAYVVPKPEHTPTAHQLRSYLKRCLPNYLIPHVFIVVDALPRTLTGKVDRLQLRDIDLQPLDVALNYVEPRSATEASLVQICETLLGMSPIGITDSFLELGGDSLLAIQMMIAIHDEFGVNVPVALLFERDTVATLASFIDTRSTV